jgi:hypothetical protein
MVVYNGTVRELLDNGPTVRQMGVAFKPAYEVPTMGKT